MPSKILVLCGPTASGKTALAVELALRFNGEVVSADSMQVYRGMDIGTAKPTQQDQRGVPHHMLDVAQPNEPYSVARYVQDATPIVDDILSRGKLPIVAGGTGLYIDSLIAGREFATFSPHSNLRKQLQERVHTEGLDVLHAQLSSIDPEAAARIHPNDEKRILRALEVWFATGKTISQHDKETQLLPRRYLPVTIGLNYENRAHLWSRINQRVDKMVQQGLVDEVSHLLNSGISPDCTSMQAIGYKEIATVLNTGRPLEEGIEEVKLRSRQYAKRQLTWFRRNPTVAWYLWKENPNFSAVLQFSTEFLYSHGLR